MAEIGFHASHELFAPSVLLEQVRRAEQTGFRTAMCSDHFHPWVPEQGQSGYSFAWLGAAMQATKMSFGTICCPVVRYHPAVVAQAAATLAEMFPNRFWLALGTGQYLNEHVTGAAWPAKAERQAKVREAADVIRALWAGETVTHRGHVTVDRARLYSRPAEPPLLFGAAITPETAAWVANWADGLLTVSTEHSSLEKVVRAFRENGGEGKPMYLQSMMGYDRDDARAWEAACRNWPVSVLENSRLQDTATPEELAAAAGNVRPQDLKERKLRVTSNLNQHIEWLQEDVSLGFDRIFVYTISGNPVEFIDAFGSVVLPSVASLGAK